MKGMPPLFTGDKVKELYTMHMSGMTYQEIAAREFCDPQTVRKTLVRNGYIIRKKFRYPDDYRVEICGLYSDGWRPREVIRITGLSPKIVNNILCNERRHGRMPKQEE